MPLENYHVLKGTVADHKEERDDDTPHFQVKVLAGQTPYRIATNVKSGAPPSELKYLVVNDFQHPMTDALSELDDGLHEINPAPGAIALDYIRGNLFPIEEMRILPHDAPGPDNDLNDLLTMYTRRAQQQQTARIYAFGEIWGPDNDGPDRHFGFRPKRGIHNIHMNQGNSANWRNDDGVYQDGGLIFHYPDQDQWVGVFLAFQSQAIHTDDQTGHALDVPDDILDSTGNVRIVAAMVNPRGHDVGLETATLLNISDTAVNLAGWQLVDKNERRETLSTQLLHPGECTRIVLSGDGAQLSNRGGKITLLTPTGLKAHGVAYTRAQAKKQGWTVEF